MQLVVENEWWDYYPILFDPSIFNTLYNEVSQMCKTYKVNVNGKEYDSKRMSCYFTSLTGNSITSHSQNFNYGNLPAFEWNASFVVNSIKARVEKFLKTHYD